MPVRKKSRSLRGKAVSRKVSMKASKKTGGRKKRSVSSVLLPMEGPKSMEEVKFNRYIKQVLKQVDPRVKLNRTSMQIMDSFMKDTLHQIAETASGKMGKRKTLKPKVILKAMKNVMPRNLALHVDEHAQKVLERYSKKARRR